MNSFISDLDFFKNMAQTFHLERNGAIIQSNIKAFFCDDHGIKSIQILDDYDIHDGDYLIEEKTKKRCFISNIYPITDTDFMAHYQTPEEQKRYSSISQNIHIGTISGNAIVGNQQNATINTHSSFNDIRDYVSQQQIPSADKDELLRLIAAAEAVTKNDLAVTKSTFSQYADIAEKYSGILSIIMQPFLNWIFGMK